MTYWVDDVLSEVSHVETPKSWLWWSLISAISASAGNNYHLRALQGTLIYKPNLYIMLLGESGLGKGFPINLAKLLVQHINTTRVIAGRSSIQAIVTELSRQKSKENGGTPILDSRGFIVNGELSSAIIADVDSLAILTDLFDGQYNPEWTNRLKISGTEKLKNPYITALFGSSPAHFYDSIPTANIEGGYIGRNLIVFEEQRAKNVDLLDDNDDEIDDRLSSYIVPKYSVHLAELSKMKGRIIPENSAKHLFNSWRRNWRKNQSTDKTGFVNRVPDHVLKVAMCLCLARYNSAGVINNSDVEIAIDRVTNLIYANKMTSAGKGLDPSAGQQKLILDILIRAENNELTRRRMLSQGHGNFDSYTLDRIVETLEEMGWVDKVRHGNEWLYRLAGEPLVNYKKFKADLESKR